MATEPLPTPSPEAKPATPPRAEPRAGAPGRPGPGPGAPPPPAGKSLRAARGALPAGAPLAGADALGALAALRKMDLAVVAQRRDVDGPMVDRALAVVRRFILERGLILFGGLAIDYALRLKG